MNKLRSKHLKKIDKLVGYTEKLEYLNGQFLKAKTDNEERIILGMIDELKKWGC